METLVPITYLNDFVFCPYSVYLHQVFDNSHDSIYQAEPQQRGKNAHQTIDAPVTIRTQVIKGMYVGCKCI